MKATKSTLVLAVVAMLPSLVIFIREWDSDEEGFYIDYYARDETCGWVLVP